MRIFRLFLHAGAAGVLLASGCTEKPIPLDPIETGPGTVTQARKFLEGRWSLVSFNVYGPGGQAAPITGAGTLTYDDFGNLAIEIRVDEKGSLVLEKAGVPVDQGVVSSSGRTVLDMQRQALTYVIKDKPVTGAESGPLAAHRPRYWQVEGDLLTLTTKDDAGNPLSVAAWKRER
jgi:hypothetical protein